MDPVLLFYTGARTDSVLLIILEQERILHPELIYTGARMDSELLVYTRARMDLNSWYILEQGWT